MKTKRGQIFDQIQMKVPSANWFDLSHDVKMSLNMGGLVPTCVLEVLPGDYFKIGFENLLRFAPLLSPVMHKIKVTTHYFFVPNRILWEGWEDWITGNIDVEPPFFTPVQNLTADIKIGSIGNYMGLPRLSGGLTNGAAKINALPFAAYAKIFLDYYLDQNNTSETTKELLETYSNLIDGDNTTEGQSITGTVFSRFASFACYTRPLPRAWMHDYFTSALPFAQKGDQVFMPIADFNDVDVEYGNKISLGDRIRRITDGSIISPAASEGLNVTPSSRLSTAGGDVFNLDPDNLVARTSDLVAGAASINNLRSAFRLQEWLEKNARGGTRYNESILSHFGVRSSDSRLQRAEYLGGAVQNMVISEVLATAETLSDTGISTPLGQLGGHGISLGGGNMFNYRAEEHGWIIGLINVMPDTAYYQGLDRKFERFDRLEYYWPSFAHLGEQEVWNSELMFQNENGVDSGVFGYLPRYTEYRYEKSRIAGEFATSLDFWTLARTFSEEAYVPLNEDFIYPYPIFTDLGTNLLTNPFDRIFVVSQDEADTIYAHVLNKVMARRLMPVFGTPSF